MYSSCRQAGYSFASIDVNQPFKHRLFAERVGWGSSCATHVMLDKEQQLSDTWRQLSLWQHKKARRISECQFSMRTILDRLLAVTYWSRIIATSHHRMGFFVLNTSLRSFRSSTVYNYVDDACSSRSFTNNTTAKARLLNVIAGWAQLLRRSLITIVLEIRLWAAVLARRKTVEEWHWTCRLEFDNSSLIILGSTYPLSLRRVQLRRSNACLYWRAAPCRKH